MDVVGGMAPAPPEYPAAPPKQKWPVGLLVIMGLLILLPVLLPVLIAFGADGRIVALALSPILIAVCVLIYWQWKHRKRDGTGESRPVRAGA